MICTSDTMPNDNRALNRAQRTPDDEWYTRYQDIESEIATYPPSVFRNRTVYCNCDGPSSNFRRFFTRNFARLGLKKLICTSYAGEGFIMTHEGSEEFTIIDGDFRHNARFLTEADLVCTNPPFTLAREFVLMMFRYRKEFLIVGPTTLLCTPRTLPYTMQGRLHKGSNNCEWFTHPDGSPCRIGNGIWITNLDSCRKHPLLLKAKYDPAVHRFCDGSGILSVGKVAEIPSDYFGVMAVPETFLTKDWIPLFHVVGKADTLKMDGKTLFRRILIKRR